MSQAKFWVIALVSCLTVGTASNQQATAQQGSVDLRGNWKESSAIFYWSKSSNGCEANNRVVSRKLTISQKGSSLAILPFRYWGNPQGQRGAYGESTVKVSGKTVSFTLKGGGFTAKYKGTISNDGNQVSGQVACTHNSGKANPDVPFTLTRLGSPINGLD